MPMKLSQFLEKLNELRMDEVVVTTMASARDWPEYSDSPLDLNYAPSSMGQGSALGLGIALARPERKVIVINGDGCMLMNLGSLVTIANLCPSNLILVNIENGVYEVTGGQPYAGAGEVSFTGLARSAGWESIHEFKDASQLGAGLRSAIQSTGPSFINVKTDSEPGPSPKARRPIYETIDILTKALDV